MRHYRIKIKRFVNYGVASPRCMPQERVLGFFWVNLSSGYVDTEIEAHNIISETEYNHIACEKPEYLYVKDVVPRKPKNTP